MLENSIESIARTGNKNLQPLLSERSYQVMSSPIGDLNIVSQGDAIVMLTFGNDKRNFDLRLYGTLQSSPVIELAIRQLQEYFAGSRKSFDIPLNPLGTDFQVKAWMALAEIPFGQTRSYQQQAEILNKPQAVRAIGRANGLNPISILLPCHRVIGKSGKLVGYAGGLLAKEFLLNLEAASV